MNTFYSNNINFSGKTFDIKKAKNVNKLAHKEFNYQSPWKKTHVDFLEFLENSGYYTKDPKSTEFIKIQDKINKFKVYLEKMNTKLKICRQNYTNCLNNPFEYYKQLILNTKRYKTLNCGEFSRLIYVILRLNKIKDANISVVRPIAITKDRELHSIDHCAVKIETKSSEDIIIDGLFDEIGTPEEITKIYTNKYQTCLNIPQNTNLIFVRCGSKTNPENNMPRLNDEETNKLKKLFPKLVINI